MPVRRTTPENCGHFPSPEWKNDTRLGLVWPTALYRPPSGSERAVLDRTLQRQLATYTQDKVAAKKLASVGDLPKAPGLDDTQLAAWSALANVLLNLNETISN